MMERYLRLPAVPRQSFFLWGARQSGKSTLLQGAYPQAFRIDLLLNREVVRFSRDPGRLREEVEAAGHSFVVIDEIQKVPQLLDEAHWLIENRGVAFALCGSSARKGRRGHANLLGGRAIRYELLGVTAAELGDEWDLVRMLNRGYLPAHYLGSMHAARLRAYVEDYLKEEVMAEGLTRNLPAFSSFLGAAALGDGQLVNFSTIARDCGVSAYAVKNYFQILVDSLLASLLPAYKKRPKRRVVQGPKFYFADVGVVNHLAKRGNLQPGSAAFGSAFENWVHHELQAYRAYHDFSIELSYWRLASGIEVDFIIDDMRCAVEAKATANVHDGHLKGLREVAVDHAVGKRVMVSLDERPRRTPDGIDILPAREFVARLWSGSLTG